MSKPYRAWVAAAAVAPLLASLHAPRVLAETVLIGDRVQVRQTDVARPSRGMSMAQVQKHFGEPRERHPTVGTPPITRWDYEHFAVFFEKDLVIDAVVPGTSGGAGDSSPAATPASAPSAAPIPAATPPAAAPALDAAGIPLHQPDPVQPASATATATAAAPAAAAASHDAGDASKDAAAPLSNVSLHH